MAKITISETFAWKVVKHLRRSAWRSFGAQESIEATTMADVLAGRLEKMDKRLKQRGQREQDVSMVPREDGLPTLAGERVGARDNDPDHDCSKFIPSATAYLTSGLRDCDGDGHHMCDECAYKKEQG